MIFLSEKDIFQDQDGKARKIDSGFVNRDGISFRTKE